MSTSPVQNNDDDNNNNNNNNGHIKETQTNGNPFQKIKEKADEWENMLIDDINCEPIKEQIFSMLDAARIGIVNMHSCSKDTPIIDFCLTMLSRDKGKYSDGNLHTDLANFMKAMATLKKIMRHDYIRLLRPHAEATSTTISFTGGKDKVFKEEQVLWKAVANTCDAIICTYHSMIKMLYYDQKLRRIRDESILNASESYNEYGKSTIEAFYGARTDTELKTLNDSQKLYEYALQKLSMINAKRYRDNVVIPRIVGGHNTTTYKVYCSIDDFIAKTINREYESSIWNIYTASERSTQWAIKMLKRNYVVEFEDLVVDRRKFAFRNGVYDCQKNEFTPYNSANFKGYKFGEHYHDQISRSARMTGTGFTNPNAPTSRSGVNTAATDATSTTSSSGMQRYIDPDENHQTNAPDEPTPAKPNYDDDEHDGRSESIKSKHSGEDACNYFDLDFEDFNGEVINGGTTTTDSNFLLDAMNIETPNLDMLITAQKFDDDVRRWYYAAIGRMIYNVGELDGWEIIPFHKGVAGTGKSTVLYTMKMIYDTDDVGVMSNNIEGTFGLGALYDKFIVLCFEMRSNFNLDQAVLQSMISGEEIGIAIKHKGAIKEKWVPQIAAAGNMTADWSDSQGAIARRFMIFEYIHKVLKVDAGLMKKIKKEMHRIIYKCNCIYRELAMKYGNMGPWTVDNGVPLVLPQYFHDQAKTLKKATNSLLSFILESGMIIRPEDDPNKESPDTYYMRWDQFTNLYKKYCHSSQSKMQRMSNEDQYRDAFNTCDLMKEDNVTKPDPTKNGENVTTVWVVGCKALELD